MGIAGDKAVNKRSDARAKRVAKPSYDGWVGFVNVELSDAQKAQLKTLGGSIGEAWSEILFKVEQGYKLSGTCSKEYGLWTVSLTCKDDREQNHGLTLSGRGGSFNNACLSLWYKDVYILKGNWTTVVTSGPKEAAEDTFL